MPRQEKLGKREFRRREELVAVINKLESKLEISKQAEKLQSERIKEYKCKLAKSELQIAELKLRNNHLWQFVVWCPTWLKLWYSFRNDGRELTQ